MLLGLRSIVYAIATGNTVVFKGSEFSPRSHYLLVDVFRQAGFPPGVVSLIEHAPDVGAPIIGALIAHPAVRKINFTGSSAVGKKIAELAGKYLKPVLLELGGKASAIVLEDADLEAAAQGVASGANAHVSVHLRDFHHFEQVDTKSTGRRDKSVSAPRESSFSLQSQRNSRLS